MNYRRVIWLFCAFSMLMAGCNITYKVRNQFSDIEHIEHFSCGNVTAELVGKGNSIFTFKQQFLIEDAVRVFPDSLKIRCNNEFILLEHNIKNRHANWIELKNRKTWEATFHLEKGVFEGDTITVFATNYLSCNQELFSLDTMVYSFINNLRIKGINDF